MNVTHLRIHYTLVRYVTSSTHITQDQHPYQVHTQKQKAIMYGKSILTYNTVWKQ